MNIKFEMPEVLVVFSLFMYSQSFPFAVTAFVLGVLGRVSNYLLEYSAELKKAEAINSNIDELGTAFKDLFSAKKD